jgi:predicted nucleic acid-binding protein
MTLFGINLGGLLKVALEWVTANRRHRKELAREYQRGWNDAIAAAQSKERKSVQDASSADDAIASDTDSVLGDPNNQWSP